MSRAIEGAGFTGAVMDAPPSDPEVSVRLDPGELPAKLREVFARARELGQNVLIDIHGPG